jgi:serine/threonine protein phosphatase PrpC
MEDPRNALFKVFDDVNEKLQSEKGLDITFSGSTAITIYLHKNLVYCANVGDSRAIIAKKTAEKWSVIPLSRDHKPSDRDEAKRILQKGGRVEAFKGPDGKSVGPLRVWLRNENVPGLAMTRSMGDNIASSVGVSY